MRNVTKELAGLRERTVRLLVYSHGAMPDAIVLTCDTCIDRAVCSSAYDVYNTDGDCIERR